MGKPTKVHRQQRFQYERNRSKEWKKSKKLPSIECKQIKEAWNPHKSVKKNLRLMGLSSDPNVTFKIPTAKDLLKTQPENKQETKKQKQGVKTTVVQGLEAEASAPQPKTLQFSEPEVRYCIYMMEKYGDDYKILEVAFMEYSRPTTDNAETETDPTPPDVSTKDPQPDVDVEPEPACPSPVKPSLVSKKLQVNLKPQQRTRGHQTDPKLTAPKQPALVSASTQTDEVHIIPLGSTADPELLDSDDEPDSPSEDPEYSPDDETSSDEDDDLDEEAMSYKLNPDAKPEEEKQFLVSESSLAELLSVCRYCSSEATPFVSCSRGTMILTNSICLRGHVSVWKSQPCHNRLPWCNLMTSAAIMMSGCNTSKVLNLFQHLNLQMMSARTCNRIQSLYVTPSATLTWDSEQAQLLQAIRGQQVIVGGDARCDSPGYSAKYGSYTIMDLETSKILDFQLVQAMARDRRNYYQDTPKQIKRKINSFKTTPHQYAAYIKLKGEWQSSLENESTPRKLVVDMVATARKPTRKYVARRRNGHFTSPKTPKKIQKVREEVPLHKVKRKLHFGRKPPTQRAVQSQEKAKNIQKKPVEKKSKQHRETLPSKGGAKMSKELMDLLQMADNFIIVENMRTKSSGKSCGDLKKLSINHKLRSSPEHMNLLRQH